MNDAREKIEKIIVEGLGCDVMPGAPVNDTIDAILSELPSIVRGMIPDLIWEGIDYATSFAETDIGVYAIWEGHFRPPGHNAGTPSEDPTQDANDHHKSTILKQMGLGT